MVAFTFSLYLLLLISIRLVRRTFALISHYVAKHRKDLLEHLTLQTCLKWRDQV